MKVSKLIEKLQELDDPEAQICLIKNKRHHKMARIGEILKDSFSLENERTGDVSHVDYYYLDFEDKNQ